MGDSFAGRETSHLALPVLADFAATFAQNFFFPQDGVRIVREGRYG